MEKINDSREAILARIKTSRPDSRPMPEIPVFDVAGNPLTNFLGHLKGFDGEYKLFETRADAELWLSSEIDRQKSQTSDRSFHVGEAMLGVGETGSLFVDNRSLSDAAAALMATDLYLLVDRKTIIASLQQAYEKIQLSDYQYSSFFSGPSATADIEAVHITGAQGPIALTAVVYNCTADEITTDVDVAAATPCAPAIKLERLPDPTTGQDSI